MIMLGGIGAIILMLAVIAQIVAVFMLWLAPASYYYAGPHIDFGSGIGWAVGLILLSLGVFGFWKRYNDRFMFKIGVLGIISAGVGLGATVVMWIGASPLSTLGYVPTSVSTIFSGFGWNLLDLIGIAGIVWFVMNGVFSCS